MTFNALADSAESSGLAAEEIGILPPDDDGFGTSTSVSGNTGRENGEYTPSGVMFVCVAGYDTLQEKLGETEAGHAIDRCLRRTIRVAEAFSEHPVEKQQREIFALFNHVDGALRAALEMQSRVSELPPVSGVQPSIKIGIAYGLVEENCNASLQAIVDMAINLAWLAEPRQIVACPRTQKTLSLDMAERFETYCQAWKKASAQPLLRADHYDGEVDEPPAPDLMLRFNDETFMLNDSQPEIRIGRHMNNHVVLLGDHVSRFHAIITRRGNKIVLSDTSRNGTVVAFKYNKEYLRLVKGECVLHGFGVLSFAPAYPVTEIGPSSVQFEML